MRGQENLQSGNTEEPKSEELQEKGSKEIYDPQKNEKSIEKSFFKNEEEGKWRTNMLLHNSTSQNEQVVFVLRHTTSFEDVCMENHGKTLIRQFTKAFEENKEEGSFHQQQAHKNMIDEPILLSQLDYEIFESSEKNMLYSYFIKSAQTKSMLSFIFNSVSQEFVPFAFKLFAVMIQQYKKQKVHLLSEAEMFELIEENVLETSTKIMKILEHQLFFNLKKPEFKKVQELASKWMETIFMGMNGIFQKTASRRVSYEELLTDEEDIHRPYKLTKKN